MMGANNKINNKSPDEPEEEDISGLLSHTPQPDLPDLVPSEVNLLSEPLSPLGSEFYNNSRSNRRSAGGSAAVRPQFRPVAKRKQQEESNMLMVSCTN